MRKPGKYMQELTRRIPINTRSAAKRLLPLLVAGVLSAPAAWAGVIYSIQMDTLNPAPGTTGDAFDVLLTNTGPSSLDIAAFSFGVFTADTDITLTEADVSTVVSSYVFAGNSFVVAFLGSPVISITSGAQTLTANDTTNTPSSFVVVGAGSTVDLGRVLFNVAANAGPQTFTISFTGSPGVNNLNNNLSDQNGDAISVDSLDSVNFSDTQAVPEPGTAVPLLAGLTCLWMFSRRLRSGRRARIRTAHFVA
jgi:hypothetical protein